MSTLHPLFAAALGRDVEVGFATPTTGRQIVEADLLTIVAGKLGVVLNRDDVLTDLVVETDGGATVIPVSRVTSLKEIAS